MAVLQGATGVITRGWFEFNNADSGGGLQADGTVRADGPEFTRNHARRFGGAIDHDFGDSVFKRTTVTGDTAGLDGGAVDIDLGTIEFVDSKIRNNTSAGTRGGGIYNNCGSVTLGHSTVRGNASTVAPGGVFTLNQFTVIRSTIASRCGSSMTERAGHTMPAPRRPGPGRDAVPVLKDAAPARHPVPAQGRPHNSFG
ncbi:hypothetical protein ACF1GW_10185 [Streptomyces achromogenes]|uniref:hypothetical protein n=1 Tax=Streptomyces achromogenes TaxID=67255 RepID=UPI0036F72842